MQQSSHLRVVEPGGQIRDVPLAPGVTTIGESSDNHVMLVGGNIASRHAQLLCDARSCRLVDLGSSSGTRVNGRAVPPNLARRLQPGDVIEIGDYRLHYEGAGDLMDSRSSPAPQVLPLANEVREVPRMSSKYRQQRVVLWIIGAMGVVAAVGLVALLAWIFFFNPRAKDNAPTPTPVVAEATSTVVAMATDTPAPLSPTATLPPPVTASATATEPLPTLTPTETVQTPESTVVAEAVTATPVPTEALPIATATPIPTWPPTAVVIAPTWTPVPIVATATPSPWGMVNAATANVTERAEQSVPGHHTGFLRAIRALAGPKRDL